MDQRDKAASEGAPTPGSTTQGAPVERLLTANELRRLAEAADGTRGEILEIVVERNGPPKLSKVPPTAGPSHTAIRVKTEIAVPGRQLPANVELTLPDRIRKRELNPTIFDAVFWGEAAAEKFLKPYYIRFYSAEEMNALLEAMHSKEVLALAHIYPTFYEPIDADKFLSAEGATARVTDDLWVLEDDDKSEGAGTFLPLTRCSLLG